MRNLVYTTLLTVLTSTVVFAQGTPSPLPISTPVPSLSIWGMVALGVMFAIVAVIMIRKRFSSQS